MEDKCYLVTIKDKKNFCKLVVNYNKEKKKKLYIKRWNDKKSCYIYSNLIEDELRRYFIDEIIFCKEEELDGNNCLTPYLMYDDLLKRFVKKTKFDGNKEELEELKEIFEWNDYDFISKDIISFHKNFFENYSFNLDVVKKMLNLEKFISKLIISLRSDLEFKIRNKLSHYIGKFFYKEGSEDWAIEIKKICDSLCNKKIKALYDKSKLKVKLEEICGSQIFTKTKTSFEPWDFVREIDFNELLIILESFKEQDETLFKEIMKNFQEKTSFSNKQLLNFWRYLNRYRNNAAHKSVFYSEVFKNKKENEEIFNSIYSLLLEYEKDYYSNLIKIFKENSNISNNIFESLWIFKIFNK